MNKYLNLFFFMCTGSLLAHGQWTPKDSINLRRILDGEGEIKLNPHAVNQIDFDSFIGTPRMSTDKPALKYDTNLPFTPKNTNMLLTLKPYASNTKFNWDPIYKRKVKVGPDSWRSNPWSSPTFTKWYTNWTDEPVGTKIRSVKNPTAMLPVGAVIGGLDFNVVFTREFWDKSIEKRRNRTLEVLRNYGDSTTVLYNQEIKRVKIDR